MFVACDMRKTHGLVASCVLCLHDIKQHASLLLQTHSHDESWATKNGEVGLLQDRDVEGKE